MTNVLGGGLGGRYTDPSRLRTTSVSADDRKIARKYPTSPGSAYHLASGKTSTRPKPRAVSPLKVSSRMPSGPTAISGGQRAATPTGWLDQVKPKSFAPTQVAQFNPAALPGDGARTTAAQGQASLAQQGDWGLNAAAMAQVGLIKDWTNDAVEAAGESAIGRGMGRSGSYDAVRVDAAQEGALQAANQMAQAAAEQGRLNQEVAIKNAELGTSVSLENASMINEYAMFLRQQGLAEYEVQQNVNLAYKQFDEGRRQFEENHALDTTQANRGYQMDRLGYNEGIRQFNETAGTARYNAQTGRYDAETGRYSAEQGAGLGWAELAAQQDQFGQTMSFERQKFEQQLEVERQAALNAGEDPAMVNARVNAERLKWQMDQGAADRAFSGGMNPNSYTSNPAGLAYLRQQYPWLFTQNGNAPAGMTG